MCDVKAADSKESAGAPEEIEVTPAMIEAGASIIERDFGHDPTLYRGLALVVSEDILRAAGLGRSSYTR
jgi:hypothetical protein